MMRKLQIEQETLRSDYASLRSSSREKLRLDEVQHESKIYGLEAERDYFQEDHARLKSLLEDQSRKMLDLRRDVEEHEATIKGLIVAQDDLRKDNARLSSS